MVQPKPPPPVWTLIKMPPPIVDMLKLMLPKPIMDQMTEIINEVKPFVVAYVKTFAKIAAEWLQTLGKNEVAKQLQKIIKGKQDQLKLTKFTDKFHKYAIAAVFSLTQPHLKRVAQTVYNEAMFAATHVSQTRIAATSGTDLIAAAKSVLSPEIIGNMEGLVGDIGPILKKFIDGVMGALTEWRNAGGDIRIAKATEKLRQEMEAAGSVWPPDWKSVDVRIPVQVPVFEFMSRGLLAVGKWLKEKLSKIGGEVAAQVDMLDLDTDCTANALRREFSKLVQVNVIDLARQKIIPQLNKAIDAVGLPNRVLVSQLRSIVYDMGEAIIRKSVNAKILAIYTSLMEQVKLPNVLEPEPEEEEEEEDEFGYTADEDSYKDLHPRFSLAPAPPGGAGALQAEVNKIVDKDVLTKMKESLGPILPVVEAFVAGAGSAGKRWYEDTGKLLLEEAEANAKAIFDKDQLKKKPKLEMSEVLAKVKSGIAVPVFEFIKAGLQEAMNVLIPFLEARGGAVMAFVERLGLPLDDLLSMKASDLRRSLSQLMQEFIVDKSCKSIIDHVLVSFVYCCYPFDL